MIIFDLTCTHGHRFEGWFASAEDFARQAEASMVHCPVCDDGHVAIVPSARVHVGKSGHATSPAVADAPAETPETTEEVTAGVPVELLRKLREAVRSAEDVGRRFPEEARKVHYEEVPARAIRGQASKEEAEALRDEGIDFASVPPFLLPDQH